MKIRREIIKIGLIGIGVTVLGGCATQGGLNLDNSQTTGSNKNKLQTVKAKVAGTESLNQIGLSDIKTVFIPYYIAQTGGNGDAELFINGSPFSGTTGSAIPLTFIDANYGYLVAAQQSGGTCNGEQLPTGVNTVFYKVSKTGQIRSEVKCLNYAAKAIAVKSAIYYSSEPGYGGALNWTGIKPNGSVIPGPNGVSMAIPLSGGKWFITPPESDDNIDYYIQGSNGDRKKIYSSGSFWFNPMPVAVYVNTPPYYSSMKTGYSVAGFQNGPDATSGGENTGGAIGVQVLFKAPPQSCYGLIGRACGVDLFYTVDSTELGNAPAHSADSSFVWGSTTADAYTGYFSTLSAINPFSTSHYTIHQLASNISWRLPITGSYAIEWAPRLVITPKATIVVDANPQDQNFGNGFVVDDPSKIKLVNRSDLDGFWGQYGVIPPGNKTWH